MIIGIPKEIKDHEYRIGATPAMVRALAEAGHAVLVQRGAASRIGFTDEMYRSAGAAIVETPSEVYAADMVIKVKEPQMEEFSLLREGQILFCFLHLAPDSQLTKQLIESKVVGIAYETVVDDKGRLPLLIPMSEIAGRISVQAGATHLQLSYGGKGVLMGGVPGVAPAKTIIIGGGIVGTQAARMAVGLGSDVTVLDNNPYRLKELDELFQSRLKTLYSDASTLEEIIADTDLVIGAVLIPGKLAPKVLTRKMIKKMAPGSVIVDVAIDQGGCFETSRPTTHSNPTYIEEGVIHYCVTNMPGACARTATMALTHATCKYALDLASKGYKTALKEHGGLREGLNVCLGKVTNLPVAQDLGYSYCPPAECLK